ncbi:MAG: pyruvate ferredoxin oxidoreductase, partial [Desulfatiglandales bacterium]
IVIDRAISFGGQGGPLAIELRSSLFGLPDPPRVMNFICGLASRDVTVEDFKNIYERAIDDSKVFVFQEDFQFYGVRS